MIIIGVLAAIAIPIFLNQREAAWRSTVESDLRNAAIAVQTEATSQNGSYAWLTDEDDLTDAGYVASEGVVIEVVDANATSYELSGTHEELDQTIIFNSATGGLGDWVDD